MINTEALRRIESVLMTQGKVSKDAVLQWMQHSNLEVLGAVHELVTYSPNWERVDPPLEEADLLAFLIPFYRRCLLEDPKGEWALSRYEAAAAIASRFRALARDEEPGQQVLLVELKDLLAQVYLGNDSEVQAAIVTGALEHVLEEPRFRSFFADWSKHELLKQAYDLAMEWAICHEQ